MIGHMEPLLSTFHVSAIWSSAEPINETALRALGAALQVDDDEYCFWVDEKDPNQVIASWKVDADSFEQAARLCRIAVQPLELVPEFGAHLSEIGVSTDEAYWMTSNPEHDIQV